MQPRFFTYQADNLICSLRLFPDVAQTVNLAIKKTVSEYDVQWHNQTQLFAIISQSFVHPSQTVEPSPWVKVKRYMREDYSLSL